MDYYTGYGNLTVHNNNWLTVDPKCDLGNYFLFKFNKEFRTVCKAQKPKWGCHITVVRGEYEQPARKLNKFKALNGKEIDFEYSTEWSCNGHHIWLKVRSEYLLDLRKDFGLERNPIYPLHLTFGYVEFVYPDICKVVK